MKKLTAVILIAVMIFAAACSKSGKTEAEPTKAPTEAVNTPTAAPTEAPTPTAEPTQAPDPTDVPEPTEEPTAEPVPTEEPVAEPAGNYDDFVGTWYCESGEVEGWEWRASDEYEFIYVTFSDKYTVERIREIPDSDSEIKRGTGHFFRNDQGSFVSVEYEGDGDSYLYFLSEDGTLYEDIEITYDDGTMAGASLVYGKEAWWWNEGLSFDEPRELPEELKKYVDEAGAGRWIVAIACPSEELSAECDRLGWNLVDETDNEWVTCPWNNPQELILVNSCWRSVEIEVHEPASGYDPSTEESGWEPGPFMYGAVLQPGEMCRFVVDMPDNKADATMCLYMLFDGDDSSYYLRVFKYDQEDPYITFE
ncbi:MAG: hypothetical protein J5712_09020 [Lachnospiraceae bacterium]|nr:hypothetical protein [Lachnospiraceae bacterium]